ncbi:hypothetical protein ASG29_10825 [Sphingomonas sp. Leaf412]|uniref:hypothetical protein n=1 Tax=Sphingomonas sp. Leaf412 TaxID=1736370 RepID=UPI0006F72A04|nr:hypothetical protein [Sphingomonas sp. Leaf412]KQT32301.1 hypothetical protein ASG29_10825 [Sphingomonas sp. Leaf412]
MGTQDITIAAATHPRWGQLVSGEMQPSYACLALKLMMIRIRHQHDRDPARRADLIAEVRRFFVANLRFAAPDYRAIFQEQAA